MDDKEWRREQIERDGNRGDDREMKKSGGKRALAISKDGEDAKSLESLYQLLSRLK